MIPEADLIVLPVSKRPTELHPDTVRRVRAWPGPPSHGPTEEPKASVIVVTFDNLDFTRLCLTSVLASAPAPPFELIVVDNGSSDGSREYLAALARVDGRVTLLLNDSNLGFAAGANAGLRVARAPRLVLLNNDTMVAPDWLARLLPHLDEPAVALAGPLTNQAPGAAHITAGYHTYGEFLAAARLDGRAGRGRDVAKLTLFCAALRRDVLDAVGLLDERFGAGMFEDDDYCRRIAAAGFRIRLAEDVLVHHFGEASLGKLAPAGAWKPLFDANRRRFEEKWGAPWEGHARPDPPGYASLIQRFRTLTGSLPPNARVLVASRGDSRLCAVPDHVAGHFPQLPDGEYAGSYPEADDEALAQLGSLRAAGWTHLAFPNPARWWLEQYPVLATRLGAPVLDDPDAAVVFSL